MKEILEQKQKSDKKFVLIVFGSVGVFILLLVGAILILPGMMTDFIKGRIEAKVKTDYPDFEIVSYEHQNASWGFDSSYDEEYRFTVRAKDGKNITMTLPFKKDGTLNEITSCGDYFRDVSKIVAGYTMSGLFNKKNTFLEEKDKQSLIKVLNKDFASTNIKSMQVLNLNELEKNFQDYQKSAEAAKYGTGEWLDAMLALKDPNKKSENYYLLVINSGHFDGTEIHALYYLDEKTGWEKAGELNDFDYGWPPVDC